MKKPYLLLVGIVALLLSLFLTVGAAELPFTDVPEDAWYYDDVRSAYKSGLIHGVTETEFAPESHLTYAEAVKLACAIHQLYTESDVTLTDGTPWYQPYMEYAEAHEFLYPLDVALELEPEDTVNRSVFVTLLYKVLPEEMYLAINRVEDGAIRDVPMSANHGKAVYGMYRAGIVQGYGEKHQFNPHLPITRGEVATILARTMDAEKRLSFTMERVLSEDCRKAYVTFLKNYESMTEAMPGFLGKNSGKKVFDLVYLDADDVPEIFVMDMHNSSRANDTYIYTYRDGEIIYLGAGGHYGELYYFPQHNFIWLDDGDRVSWCADLFVSYGYGSWGYSPGRIEIYTLRDEWIPGDEEIRSCSVYQWNKGTETLTPEEYTRLCDEMWNYKKLTSTRISSWNMYPMDEQTIDGIFP